MTDTLSFSRSLYLPEAVQAAADAYADLAAVEVVVGDDAITVGLSDPDPDLADVLADELANHALHETIVRTRSDP